MVPPWAWAVGAGPCVTCGCGWGWGTGGGGAVVGVARVPPPPPPAATSAGGAGGGIAASPGEEETLTDKADTSGRLPCTGDMPNRAANPLMPDAVTTTIAMSATRYITHPRAQLLPK